MNTVEEVESAVQGFSDAELTSFRAWFAVFDAELSILNFRTTLKMVGSIDSLMKP